MPQINPALNVLRGPRQVVRVMYQRVQVWPPFRKFCDYFERPDGPLGPTWMRGIIRRTGGYDECTTIEPYIVDGHVEGDEDAPPALLATETEMVFYDDFDRPAGPLGPNWIPAAVPMDGGAIRPMPEIEFIRAWDPETDPTIDQARYAFPVALMTGDYTVDLRIDSVFGLNNSIGVLAGFDTNLASGLEFGFVSDGLLPANTGHLYVVEWFHGGIVGTESLPTMVQPWYLRIEKQGTTFRMSYSLAEGTAAFVFAVAYDRPGFNGQHVGMRIEHRAESRYTPYIAWLKVTKQVEAVHRLNDVMTVETYIGDQFVEIVTDNVHQTGGRVEGPFILYCQANTKNLCCTAVWCDYSGNDLTAFAFQQNALGQVATVVPSNRMLGSGTLPNFAMSGDPVCKLRLEVGRDGHLRFLATDDRLAAVVILDLVVPALSGDRVGFAFMWRNGGEGVCEFTDDFERAAIGPNWLQAPNNIFGTIGGGVVAPTAMFSIDAGAAVGIVDGLTTSMYWHEPVVHQSIEITVENAMGNNGYFVLFTNADGLSNACQVLEVNFYDDTYPWVPSAGDVLYLVFMRSIPGGGNESHGSIELPYPSSEPITLRLESASDGTQRAYVNGVLVLTEVDPAPVSGPYVGVQMDINSHLDAYDSARILSARGGCPPIGASGGDGTASSYHVLEVCGGLTEIPTVPDAGDLLFVLDWATEPRDLDFHMSGPSGPSGTFPGRDEFPVAGQFHTAYYQEWPVFHSFLDYDDTDSFGPEYMMLLGAHPEAPSAPPTTSTPPLPPVIYQSAGYVPGDYAVWVNLYTGAPDSNFATSDATVRMYRKPGGSPPLVFDAEKHLVVDLAEWRLVDTFRVGESSGDLTARTSGGPNWHVCDIHLTSSAYTMTRVMRIEPGNPTTPVFPD